MSLTLRPYQRGAIDALNDYLCDHEDNPCVVLPTGSGKSLVMAECIREWMEDFPRLRCLVVAHRQELVEQNYAEFCGAAPWASVGIYSSGLNRRDTDQNIIFAGIDSVYRKAGEFGAVDVLLVDEAHRIPVRGEGKYRQFIKDLKGYNPAFRVVGFTATPFRLGSGPICHRDHILNCICYEANVGDLIRDGYLCPLRSKCGEGRPNLEGIRKTAGEYNGKDLATAVNDSGLIDRAVADAIGHIRAEGRRSCVWFCVDIAHCDAVAERIRAAGLSAGVVTGKTRKEKRREITKSFADRVVTNLVNCNVFTEGFNVKHVDCVILMRPTLSKGLYTQMVGRGLRLHPDKKDCLILDYARCIETHGPIDTLEAGEVRLVGCPECGEYFSRAVRTCPQCGWTIPKEEIEREIAEERERAAIEERAAQIEILASQPSVYPVDEVKVSRHKKPGSPDSLRIAYRCGIRQFYEWVCLDHPGYAGSKARHWWAVRFGAESVEGLTVDDALQNIFLESELTNMTKTITVKKDGKYWAILNVEIEREILPAEKIG